MQKKIMIVEDEKNLAEIISKYLIKEGFKTVLVTQGDQAMEKFYSESPDLVLLDINLPGMSGWEICREIRKISQTPIIIMTARDTENEEIKGLSLGADDYVTKPFTPKLLEIKIKKILKMENTSFFKMGEMSFDTKTFLLTVEGESVELTRREANAMDFLFRHKGEILQRETLLNEIWGFDFFGDERAVDTLVKRLRKKLGRYGECIRSVRGVGYVFEEIQN